MVGSRLKISTLAAITVLAASAAQGADYSQPYSPPQPIFVQPPQNFAEGWYLRGFVGIGINDAYKLEYLPAPANVGNGFVFDHNSNGDTFFLGGGVGYEWNNWLRFDGTVEYRARTQVNARGVYNPITGEGDAYQGYLKSWVFLANAYVDLGRLGAGAATISLTIAFLCVHLKNGFFLQNGGYEYAMLWAVVCFAIFLRGGGPLSIDARIGKEL